MYCIFDVSKEQRHEKVDGRIFHVRRGAGVAEGKCTTLRCESVGIQRRTCSIPRATSMHHSDMITPPVAVEVNIPCSI